MFELEDDCQDIPEVPFTSPLLQARLNFLSATLTRSYEFLSTDSSLNLKDAIVKLENKVSSAKGSKEEIDKLYLEADHILAKCSSHFSNSLTKDSSYDFHQSQPELSSLSKSPTSINKRNINSLKITGSVPYNLNKLRNSLIDFRIDGNWTEFCYDEFNLNSTKITQQKCSFSDAKESDIQNLNESWTQADEIKINEIVFEQNKPEELRVNKNLNLTQNDTSAFTPLLSPVFEVPISAEISSPNKTTIELSHENGQYETQIVDIKNDCSRENESEHKLLNDESKYLKNDELESFQSIEDSNETINSKDKIDLQCSLDSIIPGDDNYDDMFNDLLDQIDSFDDIDTSLVYKSNEKIDICKNEQISCIVDEVAREIDSDQKDNVNKSITSDELVAQVNSSVVGCYEIDFNNKPKLSNEICEIQVNSNDKENLISEMSNLNVIDELTMDRVELSKTSSINAEEKPSFDLSNFKDNSTIDYLDDLTEDNIQKQSNDNKNDVIEKPLFNVTTSPDMKEIAQIDPIRNELIEKELNVADEFHIASVKCIHINKLDALDNQIESSIMIKSIENLDDQASSDQLKPEVSPSDNDTSMTNDAIDQMFDNLLHHTGSFDDVIEYDLCSPNLSPLQHLDISENEAFNLKYDEDLNSVDNFDLMNNQTEKETDYPNISLCHLGEVELSTTNNIEEKEENPKLPVTRKISANKYEHNPTPQKLLYYDDKIKYFQIYLRKTKWLGPDLSLNCKFYDVYLI